MKKINLGAALLAFFLFIGLVACSEPAPTPTSTSLPPTAEQETAVEPTTTIAPPTTEPTKPTPTSTAEPTAVPTDEPTAEPTLEPTAVPTEPISYTITVANPQPRQIISVAQEFAFSGSVNPVPSQRLELLLVANGSDGNGESLLAFAEVDPATGNWQLTELIHPRRTGPATLHVRAAGTEVAVPVMLQIAEDEASTIVTVNQPLQDEIAVAGQMLLISGESRNLIDDKIQVGLFGCPADSEDNLLAQIEFEAGNGPWRAQIILPVTAASDCDTARLRVTTGGLTSNNPEVAWASDQFLTLVTPTDERAARFSVWEPARLRFSPGQATLVMGTAVNPVDSQIQIELVQDGVVVAGETAVPDAFGFWEANLVLPGDAEAVNLLLRLSTGANDSYRQQDFPLAASP